GQDAGVRTESFLPRLSSGRQPPGESRRASIARIQVIDLSGRYDPTLVAASVLIAVFSAYAALALVSRVTAARGRFRLAWLVGGSVSMGLGIWAMHFVGLL